MVVNAIAGHNYYKHSTEDVLYADTDFTAQTWLAYAGNAQ